MIQSRDYVDLRGRRFSIANLDDEERNLIARLKRRIRTHADWHDYENYRLKTVSKFYEARGLSREEIVELPAWKIAQDLGSRLAIELGIARSPDYRDELEELIRSQFQTRREFCKATGISEDMLSHVLARRKHLAIDTLTDALQKIGCALRITPLESDTQQS